MTALGLRPWALAAAFLMVSAVHAFRNDEFGLQVTVPAGYPECIANTQGHVHGVGTVLVGRDCENPGNGPAFNVWADYNTAEYPNALEMLRGERCSGPRLRWADGEWDRVLAGRRTALCRFEGPGDIVDSDWRRKRGRCGAKPVGPSTTPCTS